MQLKKITDQLIITQTQRIVDESEQENESEEENLSLSPTQRITDDDLDSQIVSPETLNIKLNQVSSEESIYIKCKKFYPPEIMKIPNSTWSIPQLRKFIQTENLKVDIDLNSNAQQILQEVLNKYCFR